MSIDQSVAELEMPERRRFLSLGTGLVTGGAVYATLRALGVLHPSEVYAQNESVDDILRGTPFKDLDINRYWEEVGQGNVFVFIHGPPNNGKYEASQNLARVLAQVSQEFGDKIRFLQYQDDPNRTETAFLPGSFVPLWLMYKDGKELYHKEGGPKDEETTQKWAILMRNKIINLYHI